MAGDLFAEKNANRKACKGTAGSGQRRQYNTARSLRRTGTTNGAFGIYRTQKSTWYRDLVTGTTGPPPSREANE